MLKPKTHSFRLKVLLSKLEAVSNKVASRCHAALRLDNEELFFKASPELKKNVAVFNAEVESENVSLQFDEITGLYQGKTAAVVFELETQGTRVKIGEVQLNLGAILNEKKYRIVNSFPLAKCYDKTAKAKISVDFVPLSAPAEHAFTSERKLREVVVVREGREGREGSLREAASEGAGLGVSPSVGWKQSGYKSRLAEESNFILQEKIYEYEQKMDNYRLSQTQLQEKLHEQISNKDEQLAALTAELSRRTNQVSSLTLQGEQLRYRIKQLGEEVAAGKQASRSLMGMVQGLQHEQDDLKKQVQALRGSLENQGRTKESKEKHYAAELAKYTQRYLESEQERNKIVFQLEAKFKEEIEKKDNNYRTLIASNDKKHADATAALRQKTKELEADLADRHDTVQRQVHENKRLAELLQQRTLELADAKKQLESTGHELAVLQTAQGHLSHELQTLTFSYHELERQVGQLREEAGTGRRAGEQLRMELLMANQTIEEQRKSLTKYGKELQVHQERAYYLAERYNDDMEIKSQQEENIRGETLYYREELHKLRNQLRLAEEHAEEQAAAAQQSRETLHRIQLELSSKNQAVVRAGEERLQLQTENRSLRNELGDLQEALLLLKEENLQLGDCLRQKKTALESDKSLEWSYKIEELQLDISEMVEKFKVEKDLLREAHRKEEAKRKEEIAAQALLLRKAREENEDLRRALSRREAQHKEHDHAGEELRVALRERDEEVAECREKMRIYAAEVEELEGRLAGSEERHTAKLREAEQQHQRELKSLKKTETIRTTLNRVISHLVEYLSKPSSAPAAYQEVPATDLDPEIATMINLSVKKFCEERTRMRETIKRLEGESFFKADKEQPRFQEKRIISEAAETPKRTYFKEDVDAWKYQPSRPKDAFEGEALRDENQRLKRELSQLRVKVRSLEDEVGKAERNCDAERYSREAVKHELEDMQDQLEKIAFQLKRKEKLILEYEAEMREMQTELLSNKSLTATPTKAPVSRSEIRQREKEECAQNGRNTVVIRDLEGRLEQRNKEYEQLAIEGSRLRGQVSSLGEALANSRSENKALEGRLKERNAKVVSLEEQLISLRASLDEEHQREALKQQKRIADLEEHAGNLEEESHRSQQAVAALEKEVGELERRVKQAREQGRASEGRVRREGDQAQAKLKETIQQLEHSLLTTNSEAEQLALRNKESASRIASLTALVAKKGEEVDKLAASLNSKVAETAQLREAAQQAQREYEGRVGRLMERLEELQTALQEKDYELQEYRFTAEGRLMDLEKRLEETMQLCARKS